jgi:hypothetical protein
MFYSVLHLQSGWLPLSSSVPQLGGGIVPGRCWKRVFHANVDLKVQKELFPPPRAFFPLCPKSLLCGPEETLIYCAGLYWTYQDQTLVIGQWLLWGGTSCQILHDWKTRCLRQTSGESFATFPPNADNDLTANSQLILGDAALPKCILFSRPGIRWPCGCNNRFPDNRPILNDFDLINGGGRKIRATYPWHGRVAQLYTDEFIVLLNIDAALTTHGHLQHSQRIHYQPSFHNRWRTTRTLLLDEVRS